MNSIPPRHSNDFEDHEKAWFAEGDADTLKADPVFHDVQPQANADRENFDDFENDWFAEGDPDSLEGPSPVMDMTEGFHDDAMDVIQDMPTPPDEMGNLVELPLDEPAPNPANEWAAADQAQKDWYKEEDEDWDEFSARVQNDHGHTPKGYDGKDLELHSIEYTPEDDPGTLAA